VLADIVVIVHLALVVFITAGLPMICLGVAMSWSWVRSRRWRAFHAAASLLVALESILGIACPLTAWEDRLRSRGPSGGFIERWIDRMLFYDLPPWVFTLSYTAFAIAVSVAWWTVPPNGRRACASGAAG
jgi:hypothetical protein